MKSFRKTASILLAMSMTAMLSTTALAANTQVALPSTEGATSEYLNVSEHTYNVYQIFSGRQEKDNNSLLCDIQWGSGINATEFLTALKAKDSAFSTCTSAEDVAKVLANSANNSERAKTFAALADQYKKGTGTPLNSSSTIDGQENLAAGYYLVVDTTLTNGEYSAKNLSLLQFTTNTSMNITSKTAVPMVEKKVKEESFTAANQVGDTGYSLETGYNDVADYDIGDDVPFMLIGTMPTTLADYSTYRYVFHDTLSAGLTFNNNSVEVYLYNDNNKNNVIDDNEQVQVNTTGNYAVITERENLDCTFEVSFNDIKKITDINGNDLTVTKDSKIIVKYTAELNSQAEIGLPGNPNTVYLQYSNNPNYTGTGSQNPDNPNPDEPTEPTEPTNPDDNTGKTPEDKVIVFTYELDVTKIDGEDVNKTKLNGAEFTLKRESDNKYYNLTNDVVTWVDSEDNATKLTTVNGVFKVVGIEDGTYFLKETKAPTGYNLITEEIKVIITATTANNQEWDSYVASDALTGLTIKVENENATAEPGTLDDGIVKMEVLNSKGSLLPETGGVGTVLIYTIGAILAVGSVVLLVTKKRMNK